MSKLEIHRVPMLSDNYGYLLRDEASEAVGIVDPSEARPVLEAAERLGWKITHVLNTHHHPDHTGGNREIKAETGATVVGPKQDESRIPDIDIGVDEGDTFDLGKARADIYFIPGHTRGHIAFHFPESEALFSGDTLFLMGCGRLFEGTPAQMWNSLQKLRALPPETKVYCGHEYTQANARFALSVDPGNEDLKARARQVDDLRAQGESTVPATLEVELKTNPFLRADDPGLADVLGMGGQPAEEVFAEVRHRKDVF